MIGTPSGPFIVRMAGYQGIELVEQSLACPGGFGPTYNPIAGVIHYTSPSLYNNKPIKSETASTDLLDDPKNKYHAAYPLYGRDFATYDVGFLYFGGQTKVLPGGALQMAAGYEGKGKSAAQGGVAKIYDIDSQFLGQKTVSPSSLQAGGIWLERREPEYCD